MDECIVIQGGQHVQRRNNLDKCFDSIFENQLRFQIEEKEVTFVQNAIETLVEKLMQAIDKYGRHEKDDIIDGFLRHHVGFKFICNGTENDKNILRAGSFYEETKNGFPDEFDFIYVVCTFEVLQGADAVVWLKHYFTLNDFHETIKDILTRAVETEKYTCYQGDDEGPVIFFDGYNRTQGPSSKLSFMYVDNDIQLRRARTIDVDIVPAFKVLDNRLPERILEVCNVAGFADEIAEMGSYIITNEVSFTGTESRFMRKRLSHCHKKAYRLLKYIFNGCSDGERLRKLVPKAGISTYMIKVATIHHHYECKHGSNSNIKPSQCVLTILEEILQYCIDYQNNDVPRLKKFHGGEFEMQRDNVEQTIEKIEKMLTKFELLQSNIIATKTIKSISESILDTIQMQSSTGNLSGHSSRRHSISEKTSRKSSLSSVHSKRLSRSLDTSLHNVEISLADDFEDRLSTEDKNLYRRRRRWDTYSSDEDIKGTTVNTHDNIASHHYDQVRRYTKLHDQFQSLDQERSTPKNNFILDTHFREQSKNKKSRWCNVI